MKKPSINPLMLEQFMFGGMFDNMSAEDKTSMGGAAASMLGGLIPTTKRNGTTSIGGSTASGALKGIGAGAMFGPPGMIIGGAIGGLTSFLGAKKEKDAEMQATLSQQKQDFMSFISGANLNQGNGSNMPMAMGGFMQDNPNQGLSNSSPNPLIGLLKADQYNKQFMDTWNTDPKIKSFRDSFKKNFGEDPDPFDKNSKYDYVGAVLSGDRPTLDPEDGLYHWSSRFKADDHPNRFVKGQDTKYASGGSMEGGPQMMNPLLVEFNEGGTHESNPLGGIPQGTNSEGKTRTVEEGETAFTFKGKDKYIFSNRLSPLSYDF